MEKYMNYVIVTNRSYFVELDAFKVVLQPP